MRILRCGAALALVLGVSVAQAAGLGKLTVNSALGQILNAEIDLVSLQPGELEALTARVATPEAFRDARIEYSPALRLLRFSVEKRANGQPYLKVTSVAPVNEPFVDVLIEVTWPSGRIQREYPILLDPPGYAQQKVAPPTVAAAPSAAANTPPASAPAVSSATPAPSADAAPSSSGGSSAATGGPSARAELGGSAPKQASGDTYGPVQKGDTLRKIAEETKPANVSLEQMLVALYRENNSAFVGNNMNRLRAGQILKVPSSEEVEKVSRGDANKEIRTHVADWKSYREQVAGGVSAAPSGSGATPNAAAGRIGTAAVTPPPAPQADASKDVLKLSKSDAGKAAGKAGAGKAGGADRAAAMQEELIAKDKALAEANSRVADLEKQIRDMQRLLDLKGGAAGKAGDAKVAVAPTPATKAPEPAKPAEPVKAPEPAKVDTKAAESKTLTPAPAPTPTTPDTKAPDTKVATAPTDATKAEPAKVADASKPADAAKPADAPKPAAKKAAPPPKSRDFTDDLIDNWPLLAGLGVLAAGGIGALMFMRNRRRRYDDGPSSALTSAFPSDMKPDSTTGKAAGGGLVDTGNSSFLTDFDKTGPGTIDTDEVDPVAEAEVYIAYGRDAQAEEILKEAMARDRNRHEIALKLLEIYHARKSATAFETVAKELRNAVGENHPMWQKAAAMGAQIDPNNPLYVGAASGTATFQAMSSPAAPPAAAPKPDLDFDLEAGSTQTNFPAHQTVTTQAPDFDLDLDAKPGDTQRPPEAPHTLDFDLAPSAPATVDVPTHEPAKEEKPSFDFDLSGLDFPGTKAPAPAAESKPAADFADLNLDLPGDSGGGGGEAVGTKLELAKAYLEIGDKDGAREILQEVAKEGSSAQREEAQKLISSL